MCLNWLAGALVGVGGPISLLENQESWVDRFRKFPSSRGETHRIGVGRTPTHFQISTICELGVLQRVTSSRPVWAVLVLHCGAVL